MRFAAAAWLASIALVARVAHAESCARPDTASGYAGFTYGAVSPSSYDGSRLRVHYVQEGPHAVAGATGEDGVPDIVRLVAEVGDDALAAYEVRGFRAPVAEGKALCGGDARLDLYLVAFNQADGLTATESCVSGGAATTCAGFVLVDARLDLRYPTAGAGVRTVVPHELFHVVQNAYDADASRFWAEGTAQWAAATLDPTLPDLESYLPSFLNEPSRALDAPASGVTAAYLYGAALWPVFLAERYDPQIIEAILAAEATGLTSLAAADAVLRERGTSLAEAYGTFVVWNTATGKRAGPGGYPRAAHYPLMPLRDFPTPGGAGAVKEIMSGLSGVPYRLEKGPRSELSLTADPARTTARFVPVREGTARIEAATPLPTIVPKDEDGIVVVVALTTSKADAPFTLARALVAEEEPAAPAPPPSPPASAAPVHTEPASSSDGGCSFAATSAAAPPTSPLAAAVALLAAAVSRGRRKPVSR